MGMVIRSPILTSPHPQPSRKKHWTKVLAREKLPQQVEERLLQRISHKQNLSQPSFMFKGVQQSHHMSMCQLSILTPHPAKMSAVKSMSKSSKIDILNLKTEVWKMSFLFNSMIFRSMLIFRGVKVKSLYCCFHVGSLYSRAFGFANKKIYTCTYKCIYIYINKYIYIYICIFFCMGVRWVCLNIQERDIAAKTG